MYCLCDFGPIRFGFDSFLVTHYLFHPICWSVFFHATRIVDFNLDQISTDRFPSRFQRNCYRTFVIVISPPIHQNTQVGCYPRLLRRSNRWPKASYRRTHHKSRISSLLFCGMHASRNVFRWVKVEALIKVHAYKRDGQLMKLISMEIWSCLIFRFK